MLVVLAIVPGESIFASYIGIILPAIFAGFLACLVIAYFASQSFQKKLDETRKAVMTKVTSSNFPTGNDKIVCAETTAITAASNGDGVVTIFTDTSVEDEADIRKMGSPRTPPGTSTRDVLIHAIFGILDWAQTGLVKKQDFYRFANFMGFQGTAEQWAGEWAATCVYLDCDPHVGLDISSFLSLLNDISSDGCFATNAELRLCRDELGIGRGCSGTSTSQGSADSPTCYRDVCLTSCVPLGLPKTGEREYRL